MYNKIEKWIFNVVMLCLMMGGAFAAGVLCERYGMIALPF